MAIGQNVKAAFNKVNETYTFLTKQRERSLLYDGTAFCFGIAATMGTQEMMFMFLPSLDGTQKVIEHQAKNYANLSDSIQKLESTLTEGFQKEVIDTMKTEFETAKETSNKIAESLEGMRQENLKLREQLAQKFNLDGKVDFRMPSETALKLDEFTTFTVTHQYEDRMIDIKMTSVKQENNIADTRLVLGDAFKYTDAKGKSCLMTYIGGEKNLANFSRACS